MGVHRPGFQILSIPSVDFSKTAPAILDHPCTLPDQIGLYTWMYLPSAVCSIVLLASIRFRSSRISTVAKGDDDWLKQEAGPDSLRSGNTKERGILPTVTKSNRIPYSTRGFTVIKLVTSCLRFCFVNPRRLERRPFILLLFDIVEVAFPVIFVFLVVTFFIVW